MFTESEANDPGFLGSLSGFHPDHLADLAKSGLNAETVLKLAIRTVLPREIDRHLGFRNPAIDSLLCFPYPGIPGFCRDKVFPAFKDKDGHSVRYLQRKNSGAHLYIPPLARAVLADPTVVFYLTEGEKKTAKACQEGLPCIGLGGLWCWLHEGKPIADLDGILWAERPTVLVPDSDVWERPELLHAIYALGAELEQRGAYVRVLRLLQEVSK